MVVLGWGSVVERLVRAPVVVVVDPVPDLHPGMLQGGEALGPAQLLFESLDEALTEAVAAAIKAGSERVRGKGSLKPWRQIKPIDRSCASTQNSSRSSHFAWTINWTDVIGFSCVGSIVFASPTLCITPFKCAQLSGRYLEPWASPNSPSVER